MKTSPRPAASPAKSPRSPARCPSRPPAGRSPATSCAAPSRPTTRPCERRARPRETCHDEDLECDADVMEVVCAASGRREDPRQGDPQHHAVGPAHVPPEAEMRLCPPRGVSLAGRLYVVAADPTQSQDIEPGEEARDRGAATMPPGDDADGPGPGPPSRPWTTTRRSTTWTPPPRAEPASWYTVAHPEPRRESEHHLTRTRTDGKQATPEPIR